MSELLDAARTLGPLIREHAEQAERDRRLCKPVVDALSASGLQRMFLPRALGGLEVDPLTCAQVVEEVAGFDSAAGWALQSGNTGAWWCSRLSEQGADEIYARDRDALMAAAFHPPQRAIETDGGYRITGRGPLASGIHDTKWLMLTALIFDGDRPRMTEHGPQIIAVVVLTREARIIDTWHTLGMRGTDSNDVVVDNLFVPASRAFALTPEFEPNAHFAGPLYKFPGISEVAVIVAPVLLAIARGSISELGELAQRKTPFGSAKGLKDRAAVQAALAKAEALLRSARLLFHETLRENWARTVAGERCTLRHKADLLLAGVHAAQTAAQVTQMMHGLAGASAIYTRSRLERHFRDAQTLRHHGFVAEARYETAGQVYLGVEPEFPLVHF